MRYQFFICKPADKQTCQRLLQQYLLTQRLKTDWDKTFLPFEVERILGLLKETSKNSGEGRPLFKYWPIEVGSCSETLPVLSVTTEYSLASKVTESVSKCLVEDGLVLFDAEMGFADAVSDIVPRERQEVVTVRLAHLRHCLALREKLDSRQQKIHVSIYKLGDCFCLQDYRLGCSSVVDTSVAVLSGELPAVAGKMLGILSATAEKGGEHVYCKDGCFIVENKSRGYRLRFALEGCGKSPMYLCWIENGEAKLELLHRMGVYRTRKLIEKEYGWSQAREEEECIRSRLYFGEAFCTRGEMRNPADRFVDSFKISRMLRKSNPELTYGRHPGKPCFAFRFCEEEDTGPGWDSWKTESEFTVSEEAAAPLLALVEAVVPYFFNYYYDSFHVRREEVEQIIIRLKQVRAIASKNPLDKALGKIGERLFSYSFSWPCSAGEEDNLNWEEQKKGILYSHRRELVALYDFFEWWVTKQSEVPYRMYYGFNIIGP